MEQVAGVVQDQMELLQAAQQGVLTAISTRRSESTKALLAALLELAEARQTTVSEVGLRLYLAELARFEICDVRCAVKALIVEERGQYEAAFPQLGTLIGRTKAAEAVRLKPKPFVECGKCFAGGWVFVDAQGQRCDASCGDRRMTACDCKRAWRAARDAARCNGEVNS